MARQRFMTPLRWSDMDVYGHVNNVQFLRLLEDARVLAFHGHDGDDGGDMLSTGLVVAKHEIEYLRPLHYRPAPVAIDLWVSQVGAASIDMCYEVLDDEGAYADQPVVYARAESLMVPYNLESGRPRRITTEERTHFDSWYDDPIPWRRRHRVG